jgi:hypothetical protein
MANTYTLLETVTVGAAEASSIVFNSIPSTGYTDLMIRVSTRSSISATLANIKITFNGSGGTYTRKELYGENAAIGAEQVSDNIVGDTSGNTATASAFGAAEIYIPNYTSSNPKCFSVDSASENNIVNSGMWMLGGKWSETAAINSITISPNTTTWMQHSTFSLYGISALGTTPTRAPKATGGSIIQTDGTYWYHAFLYSGTFTPATALSCDVLVIAGGGGGGTGGGGAGGLLYTTAQSYATAQTVTVGGGGAGGVANGNNSSCGSLTATGGGGGAANFAALGSNGGSGGGGGDAGRGTGTSGQGNNGGTNSVASNNSGGGGGAGAVGGNAPTGGVGGNGGNGSNTYSTWASTTGTGSSGYYAGGGSGRGSITNGSNGLAGGGTANLGGGGSGATGSAGGSGIVIIRYLAA